MNAVDIIQSKINIDSITDILEYYGVNIVHRFGSSIRCCCPIHGGNNPTAFVWKDSGLWYCHTGCDKGGDVFNFVGEMEHLEVEKDFKQITNKVAEILNIDLTNATYDMVARKNTKEFESFNIPSKMSGYYWTNTPRDLLVTAIGDSDFFIDMLKEDSKERFEKLNSDVKKKYNSDIIEKFEVGYSPTERCVTFPVYYNGKCLFVAKRKVDYKRFIMPKIEPKPIYGIDYLTGDEVIVCESIFNALTCYVYGKEAVALFGTGSEYQIELLNKLPQRKIVLALDGDDAGRKGSKRIARLLKNKIVTFLNLPDGKDINDLTKEEFESLEEEF